VAALMKFGASDTLQSWQGSCWFRPKVLHLMVGLSINPVDQPQRSGWVNRGPFSMLRRQCLCRVWEKFRVSRRQSRA